MAQKYAELHFGLLDDFSSESDIVHKTFIHCSVAWLTNRFYPVGKTYHADPEFQAWTSHCVIVPWHRRPPPFDEHRRPMAPSNFFDNNGNNFS